MKREKWNLDTDLWEDLPDLDTGEYDGEYSLEDILSEFSEKRDSFVVQPEDVNGEKLLRETEYEAADSAATGDGIQDTESVMQHVADGRFEEEQKAEVPSRTEENSDVGEAEADLAAETVKGPTEPEEPAQAEAEKPVKRRGFHERKRQKVVEEFPEATEEYKPTADDFDYSSLFHMFADPEDAGQSDTRNQTDHTDHTEELPLRKNKERETGAPDHTEQRAESKAEPLLAENPLDFRDILREFMLGDQHPIYSEMPGIGARAGGHEAPKDDLADLDAVLESMIQNKAAPTSGKTAEKENTREASEPERRIPTDCLYGACRGEAG